MFVVNGQKHDCIHIRERLVGIFRQQFAATNVRVSGKASNVEQIRISFEKAE